MTRALRFACALLAPCMVVAATPNRAAAEEPCGQGPSWLDDPIPEPFRIGAGVSIGVLNLPNLGAGPTLMAQFGTAIPMDLSITYFFDNESELTTIERDLGLVPQATVAWPPGGSSVTMSLTQLAFGMCPLQHDLDPGTLLGCAGVFGGLLTAAGDGFVDPVDVVRASLGLEAYARWRYRLGGPIGLTYSAGLFVPLLRPGFGYVDGDGRWQEQFRAPPLGGRLDVLLTYAFE